MESHLRSAQARFAVIFGGAVLIASCSGLSPAQDPSGGESIPADFPVVTPAPDDELAQMLWEHSGEGDPEESPLHAMWKELLSDHVEDLPAPAAIVPYGPGEVPQIACKDQLPSADWTDNAFFCGADDTIAYDLEFMRAFHDSIDPSAGVAILAHEWGHHIQSVTGAGAQSIQRELQADCFAGLFASTEDIESGGDSAQSAESVEAFYRLGNEQYTNSRWFLSGEHGSPRQRFAAWSLGYLAIREGYEFCRGYDDWEPGRSVELGSFTMAAFPGRPWETTTDGVYEMEDDTLSDLRVEYVDISSLSGSGPGPLLEAWINQRFGSELGVLEGPFNTERPDEVTFFYYAAGPDADAGVYAVHGILGIQISPDDPDHALIFDVPAEGMPPISGEPGQDLEAAAEDAFIVASMASERVCAPHHTTDEGDPDTHNEMCYPDL